jgi:hypothetical protein
MQAGSRSAAFTIVLALSAALGSGFLTSQASHAAELDGAWTNNKEVCEQVFTQKDGKTVFSENADFYGSGFVIDGPIIRGKSATCKIKSMTKRGNRIHIAARCATDIMLSNTQFDLTLGTEGKLTRSFPGMPEVTVDYQRCTFSH